MLNQDIHRLFAPAKQYWIDSLDCTLTASQKLELLRGHITPYLRKALNPRYPDYQDWFMVGGFKHMPYMQQEKWKYLIAPTEDCKAPAHLRREMQKREFRSVHELLLNVNYLQMCHEKILIEKTIPIFVRQLFKYDCFEMMVSG